MKENNELYNRIYCWGHRTDNYLATANLNFDDEFLSHISDVIIDIVDGNCFSNVVLETTLAVCKATCILITGLFITV